MRRTRRGTEFVTRSFINMYDVKPRRESINVSSYVTDDVGSTGTEIAAVANWIIGLSSDAP